MSDQPNTSMVLVDIKDAGGKSIVKVDLTSKDSVGKGVEQLIAEGQYNAAEALLQEAETLHTEGIEVRLALDTDTSSSMDGAGQIERVRLAVPSLVKAAAGEIPVKVLIRHVCFGDCAAGDRITRFDWAEMSEVANRTWPHEGGGDPSYESHVEGLLALMGQDSLIDSSYQHCLRGRALEPLPTTGGTIIIVTDHERPRQTEAELDDISRLIPAGWSVIVIAKGNETLWKHLLRRENDRYYPLDSDLSGLVTPVGQAIKQQTVQAGQRVAKKVQQTVQSKVLRLAASSTHQKAGAAIAL